MVYNDHDEKVGSIAIIVIAKRGISMPFSPWAASWHGSKYLRFLANRHSATRNATAIIACSKGGQRSREIRSWLHYYKS